MSKRTAVAVVIAAFVSGALLTAGVGHTFASWSDFQVVHAEASAGTWGPTCLAEGEKQPKGEPKLPKCPKPGDRCKENVLDSYAPQSTAADPIDTLPATLTAVYHDEKPLNTTTMPPTLTIDGTDSTGAWGSTLTAADTGKDKQTLTYTVPDDGTYDDGQPHTFVITFYDGDDDGCGIATFYVQTATP